MRTHCTTGHGLVRLALISLLLLTLPLAAGCRRVGGAGTGSPSGGGRTIENKGSDTMVNLALAWAEAYAKVRPDVRISVTGGGSGTGIASLLNGTVAIANASRALSSEETNAAKSAGFAAVQTSVALDAIAVIVNPANPIEELTIPQLADIFTGRITNWRQLGGPNRPIVIVSRESNSGTYTYFLETVVRQGQAGKTDLFSSNALLMPSSEGIGNEIRQNPNAIGYDGLGYVTADQKAVRIAPKPGSPYVAPTIATVLDGTYPIARPLYMITRGQPQGDVADYMAWIKGPQGQEIVRELGFVPLPAP
jgi:phosphate transport system substrate-binding protein